MATLTLVQGTARDFQLQARDVQGNDFDPDKNPSPFSGTDDLTAKVWPGGNLAVTLTPTCSWVDTSIATFQVHLASTATATVTPGIYLMQVYVNPGDKALIFDGRLQVTQAPGTGALPLAFTTFGDLTDYCSWIGELQSSSDEIGFLNEQARATNKLVDNLTKMFRLNRMTPTLGTPGYNAYSLYQSNVPPSRWFREQIVPLVPNSTVPANLPDRTNSLPNFVDPTVSTALLLYPEIKEICAKWTLATILDGQIGLNSDKEWWAMAKRYARDANSLFQCKRFEIDLSTPQTGYASIIVDGGSSSLS